MTKIKLEFERLNPERIALAKQFLKKQKSVPATKVILERQLRAFAKESKDSVLRSDELLAALSEIEIENRDKWRSLCRKRSIRSKSGVVVVAILTKDYGCPGKCVYCPTPANMPKSYLPNEPAVLRAISSGFSPSRQVTRRLKALNATGHDTSKVELIIMGGTWSALPNQYQSNYIRSCFYALNKGTKASKSLSAEQKKNESAAHRCVGLTLETRPDYITPEEIKEMRRFGCTRVEIGVQTLYDEVSKLCKRGHGIAEVKRATELLRDAGLKVVYHMMLNLPGSSPAKDVAMFKTLFADPAYCPDQIKIYPCVLTKDAELEQWYAQGKWKPYSEKQLIDTILKAKRFVSPYCRIIRVIRDIPGDDIIAGSKTSNLRQLLQAKGAKCRCIRCREIGSREVKKTDLVKRSYPAAGGTEVFLSYEDKTQDKLIALLRLRLPPKDANPLFKCLEGAALVRELHVYGVQTPVGAEGKATQHLGLGKKLLKEAEAIAQQKGYKKLAVTSGIGVRDYYRKLGFKLKEGYAVKAIN